MAYSSLVRLLPLFLAILPTQQHQVPLADPHLSINRIPFSTRAHWMRRANQALTDLVSPCPFGAFGTAIVNHTDPSSPLGDLICIGANAIATTGNPSLHGEMAAISNCTTLLTSPTGPYNLSPSAAQAAFRHLTLYTNAESCPMCASAVRWAGFAEYVYGTSIETLIEKGWAQIRIPSVEIFRESFDLGSATRLLGEVLVNETDPLFAWQFDPEAECPRGCARVEGSCRVV